MIHEKQRSPLLKFPLWNPLLLSSLSPFLLSAVYPRSLDRSQTGLRQLRFRFKDQKGANIVSSVNKPGFICRICCVSLFNLGKGHVIVGHSTPPPK